MTTLALSSSILAKESATLDRISNGRLTLGLGTGARENDYTATGIAYTQRGKHLEEQVHQLKRIWTGQAPKENLGLIGPDPIQKDGPELLLGGFAPRAIQRVGHFADGFIIAINNIEQVNQIFRKLKQIGTDEVILFTWSTEYDQISRIEKLIKTESAVLRPSRMNSASISQSFLRNLRGLMPSCVIKKPCNSCVAVLHGLSMSGRDVLLCQPPDLPYTPVDCLFDLVRRVNNEFKDYLGMRKWRDMA